MVVVALRRDLTIDLAVCNPAECWKMSWMLRSVQSSEDIYESAVDSEDISGSAKVVGGGRFE